MWLIVSTRLQHNWDHLSVILFTLGEDFGSCVCVCVCVFPGQHECVRVINNHFSISQLDYYTTTHGKMMAP